MGRDSMLQDEPWPSAPCMTDETTPVAAFDLADEGPQLADYLPGITTIADISDTRGQMAFFDRLIADDVGAKNR